MRVAEPKPRASIDSASWIEPSALVRTTGTTTSAQDAGPRGRQPRRRCASVTSANVVPTMPTRFIDAAIAVPVRDSALGSASMTSCGWSMRENGAAAKIAAAIVIAPDSPEASASSV